MRISVQLQGEDLLRVIKHVKYLVNSEQTQNTSALFRSTTRGRRTTINKTCKIYSKF